MCFSTTVKFYTVFLVWTEISIGSIRSAVSFATLETASKWSLWNTRQCVCFVHRYLTGGSQSSADSKKWADTGLDSSGIFTFAITCFNSSLKRALVSHHAAPGLNCVDWPSDTWIDSLPIFITWVAQVLCSQLLLGLERIKHWNRSLLLEILSQQVLTAEENNCFSTLCMDSVLWFQLWLAFRHLSKQSSSWLWWVVGCQRRGIPWC